MDKASEDTFEWARKLGCPLVLLDEEKRLLNHGVVSFAWDEIALTALPVNDAFESRLNILFHYLRNNIKVPAFEHAQNTERLKDERKKINGQIEHLESEYSRIKDSMNQKRLTIARIKSKREAIVTKKMIIDLKHEELKDDMDKYNEILAVCQDLLPSHDTKIDDAIMKKCVTLAGNIFSRQEKQEAWRTILEHLGSKSIPELWKWLLNKRVEDTNNLLKITNLDAQLPEVDKRMNEAVVENNGVVNAEKNEEVERENKTVNNGMIPTFSKHRNVKLAELYGNHTLNVFEILTNIKKAREYQDLSAEYIEKLSLQTQLNACNEWLELSVEVKQLEKKQEILKRHIEYFNDFNKRNENVHVEYDELSRQIQIERLNINRCVEQFKNSLTRLENGGRLIFDLKTNLMRCLIRISNSYNSFSNDDWMNIDLHTELDEFHKNLNIDALNKIMLPHTKHPYRHALKCISKSQLVMTKATSISPVYHMPVYHIFECLKNLIVNKILNEQRREPDLGEGFSIIPIAESNRKMDIIEFLDDAHFTSDKCLKGLDELDSIYEAWAHQPVQSLMQIMDITVYKATYLEWVKRYTTLIYMIQRNK